jgi:hypothetical protein
MIGLHHTSANYELGISEFDKTTLEEFKKASYSFVKGSRVQLLCKYLMNIHIVKMTPYMLLHLLNIFL